MYHSIMNFSEWIVSELERRGWSRSEAARRGNISPSMFDKVINESSKPGMKFIEGIALAFEMDIYDVLSMTHKAKNKTSNLITEQIERLVKDFPEDEQTEILEYVKLRRQIAEQRKKNEQIKKRVTATK